MDKMKSVALAERFRSGVERLKSGGAEVGRKVGGKMKEILQGQSQEAKMVDEATSENLEEPNWGLNLRICGLLNSEEFNGSEVVRAIKRKIASKNIVSQRLSLDLLEACAMNCEKVFSEIASEKVLDDMVRMIDNPQTHYTNRRKTLQLIEAWGQSDDLGYLPVFRQTYMSLKAKTLPAPQEGHEDSLLLNSEPSYNDQAIVPPDNYPYPSMAEHDIDEALALHGGALSVEEKKEILVVARNSIEILSSMINSAPDEMPAKDDLVLSMLDKCNQSQPVIQRIIESAGDDEQLLFEALNLHDELQQVLAKYEELEHVEEKHDNQRADDSSGIEIPRTDPHPSNAKNGTENSSSAGNDEVGDETKNPEKID